MTAPAAQLRTLQLVATRLAHLRDEVVFVGGMIRGLLITDPGASAPRPTDDVDVVAGVHTQSEYYALSAVLRSLGFKEDASERAPLCRWKVDGLTVDVMPENEAVLGFTNRWYPSVRRSAIWHAIGPEPAHRIRVVDAPHFVATKLESFRGRGGGDYYHHDVEDVVAVADGRKELIAELTAAPADVGAFVAAELGSLLADDAFGEALPGHLPGDPASQARLPIVTSRLRAIAAQAAR